MPARASRPHNLFRLYLFDTASLDLPPNADERIHGQTNLPFQIPRWARPTRLTQRALSSWRTSTDVGEASRPHNFTFLSYSSDSVSPDPLNGRRREHSRPDNLTFSSPTLGKAYPSNTSVGVGLGHPPIFPFDGRRRLAISRHGSRPPANTVHLSLLSSHLFPRLARPTRPISPESQSPSDAARALPVSGFLFSLPVGKAIRPTL
ncbi:hypothetical protein G5714_001152 [Onychostoma macrolepis]|uniref:Uncharacterized protein n=1 Tax=Onychostoma macrolepis TaxID=369639 RepID=A0A7J6DJ11_9TELE|nr:hypothetical protein G5714_001152 [Onychostoma macrolepis]